MSKCPDAQDCLAMLVLPVMQRVIDKVDFTLSYIGTWVYSVLSRVIETRLQGLVTLCGMDEQGLTSNSAKYRVAGHTDNEIAPRITMALNADMVQKSV